MLARIWQTSTLTKCTQHARNKLLKDVQNMMLKDKHSNIDKKRADLVMLILIRYLSGGLADQEARRRRERQAGDEVRPRMG